MRIWKLEGLKVPPKQPKHTRLWFADGSCIRLAPTHRNHVWSWDLVFDRTRNGRVLKLMVVIDEFTRRCLAIHVAQRIRSKEALEVFADLMVEQRRNHYNTRRPHSALGYRPPAPEVVIPNEGKRGMETGQLAA